MVGLVETAPPPFEPLTLIEVKEHLRLPQEPAQNDEQMTARIAAVRQHTEDYLGRMMVRRNFELVLDGFPREIVLPVAPVTEVTEIVYLDAQGQPQTLLPGTGFQASKGQEPTRLRPPPSGCWPATQSGAMSAVKVGFAAGYLTQTGSPPAQSGDLPPIFKSAMLLGVATLYEHREDQVIGTIATELPIGSRRLLKPYRLFAGAA